MNKQNIPEEILNNPNFDINNKVVVKELDELFEENIIRYINKRYKRL